jgi:hypothetical protein
MEAKLLAGDVSQQTHDSIMAQIEAPAKNAAANQPEKSPQEKGSQDKKAQQRKLGDVARPPDASTIAGLLLGSPEFQKR